MRFDTWYIGGRGGRFEVESQSRQGIQNANEDVQGTCGGGNGPDTLD